MTDENVVGQTIAGKYRVEKVLGKGGMGIVVGARHLGLDEPVAVKILRASMMEVDGMVSRFLREAKAASKIKSDHVVRVTDVDTRDDGVPYMVMEYLDGIDFSDLRKQKGTFGVADAVGYVLQACDAIAEAHSLGIVHRDLKPGNLFLHSRRDGKRVVKVLDFGISKVDGPGEQDTTKTGQMMGSPKYMSPEQMTSMRDADARSDLWSLGAILFEFLCGRPPFVADSTPRICALVLNADPPPPCSLRPDLPPELEAIILRCLEKDPDRRYADVKALMAALAPYGPAPESSTSNPTVAAVAARSSLPSAPRVADPTASTVVPALPTPTPTPGSGQAPTVAAWDATASGETPPRASRGKRVVAGLAVAALLGVLGALYFTQRDASPVATPASDAPSTSAVPVAAPVLPTPITPGMSPNDLPDLDPSAAPRASSARLPAVPGSVAKKPKVSPSADPFGGRRN
jgi:serine/threonine-protein kinase